MFRWTEEEFEAYCVKRGLTYSTSSAANKTTNNKYGNRKIIIDGIERDSIAESNRFEQLKILQRVGTIQNLQYQVKYELIPKQQGQYRNERAVTYIADYVYDVVMPDGSLRQVVEDCKGHRTKDYIIKRKLMLYIHGISVKETI